MQGLVPGLEIYRNVSIAFEKEMDADSPVRLLDVGLRVQLYPERVEIAASREDGTSLSREFPVKGEAAIDAERMLSVIDAQLSKRSGWHSFRVCSLIATGGTVPYLAASAINSMRRSLAAELESIPAKAIPLGKGSISAYRTDAQVSYKDNVSNHIAGQAWKDAGAEQLEKAFELTHKEGAELMRSRYCIRHQLGICLKETREGGKLYLVNNGRRFALGFDCARCEMTVRKA